MDNVFGLSKNTTRSKKSSFPPSIIFRIFMIFQICLQYIFSYFRGRRYLCLTKLIYLKDQDTRYTLEDLFRVTPFIALCMRVRVCAIRYVCVCVRCWDICIHILGWIRCCCWPVKMGADSFAMRKDVLDRVGDRLETAQTQTQTHVHPH